MRVLFVSSGNKGKVSVLTLNQANSIKKLGIDVDFFLIQGKGIIGYLKSIPRLRKMLNSDYNIVHAHYSLSAFVASLAGARPLVVSLMGTDVKSSYLSRKLIKVLSKIIWHNIIVKSADMRSSLGIAGVKVIPNGVDFSVFCEKEQSFCRESLGWDENKKHILFAANPTRPEKNFALAAEALNRLNNSGIELHILESVLHEQMPLWYNASDVVLLTSLWEGSPNVIKEAMACNCPIVSTDVGDVKELIGNTEGCFISSYEPEDVASKIKKALAFGQRTNGRNCIQHLESKQIAKQIVSIYSSILKK